MIRISSVIFFIFLSGSIFAYDIYISPNGKDSNPGDKNHPVKTLYQAMEMVKHFRAANNDETINVFLREGVHRINETLIIGLEETSSTGKLNFIAYPGETPIISGGVKITDWRKADENLAGMAEAAKGNIWVADIPNDLENFRVLFDGETMLTRAKSEPWSPQTPPESIRQSDSRNVYFNKDRYALKMIHYPDEMIKEWDNIEDVEVVFNPVPWCLNILQLESVDEKNNVAWTAFEANSQPGTKDPHHAPAFLYVENALDYLDEPGEWVVNSKERKIFYWPENGVPSNHIEAPSNMELVRVEGRIRYHQETDIPAENVSFDGITFTKADRTVWYKNRKGWGIQHDWDTYDYGNAMLRFRGAENCQVTNCRFTNSGSSAIRLDLHAQKIVIENNYIDYVGHMGILLAGYGPGTKDVNKYNKIHNNIIHHCGELIWHGHAIFVWQSGHNEITNNWIHDVPRKAIGLCGVRSQILMKPETNFDEASKTIRWNEIEATIDSSLSPQDRYFPYLHARNNIVRDNKATRTMLKLSDGSSINISGAGANNLIEHNLLFDLLYTGFRTDDWQDETTIKNNIVWNCGGNAYIFKGHNYLINNIAYNVKGRAIHLRAFPQQTFKPDAVIKNNIIVNQKPGTIIYKPVGFPKSMNLHKAGNKHMPYEYIVDNNIYWTPEASEFLKVQQKEGIELNSLAVDPQFIDPENGDFGLHKKSPALKLGFVPFNTSFDSFGTTESYPDKYRKLDEQALKMVEKSSSSDKDIIVKH